MSPVLFVRRLFMGVAIAARIKGVGGAVLQIQHSFATTQTGTLFLVPTPIGNLEDITLRTLHVLKEVDLIAAEDTRHTGQLLAHFQIKTPQISFHEHNTQARLPVLLAKLQSGLSLAQVSDAGLPSISDPGQELVQAAVQAQIPVVPLPGANAGLTALIAAGLDPQPFYFYGFLPRQAKQLQPVLAQLAQRSETMILYESPHHLRRTLTDLLAVMGSKRAIVLGRELTKVHESFERGHLGELQAWYQEHEPRGEYVLILAGKPAATLPDYHDDQLKQLIQAQVDAGLKPNQAIKKIAKQVQQSRQKLYRIYHELDAD